MKKALLAALGFLVSVAALNAAPVLFEEYQEGPISIPSDERDTLTVAEVSFSVDTACYVQLSTGGTGIRAKVWLEADGESLPAVTSVNITYGGEAPLTMIYTYLLSSGEHTISFRLTNNWGPQAGSCKNGYLQALIFLPDTATNAVAEQPMSDAEPLPNTPSLISNGAFVHAPGASELVDASGRVIENAIEDNKVFISNLPQGTYFARDGERTIVKIVKVE
ncbi:hypothetical protein ES703_52186 [subsurface metagenome]